MGRYKIIDYMKKGNMLVSRSEDEAIAIAIVFEQLIHSRMLSPELDQHIVEEMEECGQVIFYYEDETIYVSKNHLGGKLVPINPFSVKSVDYHRDYSFLSMVEAAETYGNQIDELENIAGYDSEELVDDVLEEILMMAQGDESLIKDQLEAMLEAVSIPPETLEYEIEINSIRDLLEEMYGNVNTGEQKQRS